MEGDPAQPRVSCAVGYAYWDDARLAGQRTLLNPQTGRFDTVTYSEVGTQPLQVAGAVVNSRRVRLRNDEGVIDLWYAPDGLWLQLSTMARGNRELVYRRLP
jgi:hypothetical protein